MKQLVKPNYGKQTWAGGCLPAAQGVVGAPGGPVSATDSANATRWRHADRSFPRTSIAVVWFSHWGTYQNYITGAFYRADWGHVVIWDPTAFNGSGGFFSSRRNGAGPGEWFRTIADVERSFNCSFRFWSEDINRVRVCKPGPTPSTSNPTPAPTPASNATEDDLMDAKYIADDKTKTQGTIYRLHPITGKKRAVPSAEWSALRAVEGATGEKLKIGFVSAAVLAKIPNG